MSPKESPTFTKSDQLAEVDAQLESAMVHLSSTNERIGDMLTNYEAGEDIQQETDKSLDDFPLEEATSESEQAESPAEDESAETQEQQPPVSED